MTDYLLDTNHVSRFLSGDPSLVDRLRSLGEPRSRFGISMTVLAELYYAVYAGRRREENRAALESFLDTVILWDFDRRAAEEFGRIQAEQKRRGQPIPASDAQIAAVARVHDLTILTADAHFSRVHGIHVLNWLSGSS